MTTPITYGRLTKFHISALQRQTNLLETLNPFAPELHSLTPSTSTGSDPVISTTLVNALFCFSSRVYFGMNEFHNYIDDDDDVHKAVIYRTDSNLTNLLSWLELGDDLDILALSYANSSTMALCKENPGNDYIIKTIEHTGPSVTATVNLGTTVLSGCHAVGSGWWVTMSSGVVRLYDTVGIVRDTISVDDTFFIVRKISALHSVGMTAEGTIAVGAAVTIPAQSGTIYYSFDGTSLVYEEFVNYNQTVTATFADPGAYIDPYHTHGYPGIIQQVSQGIQTVTGTWRYDSEQSEWDIFEGEIWRQGFAGVQLATAPGLDLYRISGLEITVWERVKYEQTRWWRYQDHVAGSATLLGDADSGQFTPDGNGSDYEGLRTDHRDWTDIQDALKALAPYYSVAPLVNPNLRAYRLDTHIDNIFFRTFVDRYDWQNVPATDGRNYVDVYNEIVAVRNKLQASVEMQDLSGIPA